ncbi:MAG: thioredoxin domain-containing protein [Gemmatimonadales bacterium]
MNRTIILPAVSVVALIGTGMSLTARRGGEAYDVAARYTATGGQTIYEVSDFQCPYCRDFAVQILPNIDREYIQTGKAQLVFVNLPLVQIHANAAAAHEFAMCAAQQDRFWTIHDLLYRTQPSWANAAEPRDFLMTLADSAQLNGDALITCVETGAVRWLVEQEAVAVAQRGVRSTPSFIVEGLLLSGAQPMEVWRPLLDSLLTAKTGGGV